MVFSVLLSSKIYFPMPFILSSIIIILEVDGFQVITKTKKANLLLGIHILTNISKLLKSNNNIAE